MPIGAVDANDRDAVPQGGRLVLCTNKKKHAVYKKKPSILDIKKKGRRE